jgi:hypothetical protein
MPESLSFIADLIHVWIFGGYSTAALPLLIGFAVFRKQRELLRRMIDYMHIILLAGGTLMLLITVWYLFTEVFIAWYSGVEYEQYAVFVNRATGPYWLAYWMMMLLPAVPIQLLWFKRLRRSAWMMIVMLVVVSFRVYIDPFVILMVSLHRGFVLSSWSIPLWSLSLWSYLALRSVAGIVYLGVVFVLAKRKQQRH